MKLEIGQLTHKQIIKKFKGRIFLFSELPIEAQKAMIKYMVWDGEAWNELGDTEFPWNDVAPYIAEYGEEKFGLVNLPMKFAVKAIWEKSLDTKNDFPTFEAYHKWFISNAIAAPDHGDSVWPCILSNFEDELFQDGWNRFHSYYEKGFTSVPCLFYPTVP